MLLFQMNVSDLINEEDEEEVRRELEARLYAQIHFDVSQDEDDFSVTELVTHVQDERVKGQSQEEPVIEELSDHNDGCDQREISVVTLDSEDEDDDDA